MVRGNWNRLWLIPALLLAAHAGLLAYSAYVHSPTLNEPAHLAAGISHWQFGRFELYRVNPPLVRMLAALPALAAGAKTDWQGFHEGPGARPAFTIGDDFVAANRGRTIWLVTLARWACIPLSLVGGVVCYLWAGRLYGRGPGLMALALWCFSPNILAHASLITPDLGATALGALAGYLFWRWLQSPDWRRALAAGLALGLAELTKTSWIILFGLWPTIWLIWRLSWLRAAARRKGSHDPACPPPRSVVGTHLRQRNGVNPTTLWGGVGGGAEPSNHIDSTRAALPACERPPAGQTAGWFSQALQLLLLLAAALYVLNTGYGFEGTLTPLGDFQFVSRALVGPPGDDAAASGRRSGNRFAETLLGAIPVPLPKHYVLGIDAQRRDFENFGRPSYLRGVFRGQGWWYYYLYALAIKVPLGTWLLVLGTALLRIIRRPPQPQWRDEIVLLLPAVVLLVLVSSQTGFNHHMRYVLPVLPAVFIWTSQIARPVSAKHVETSTETPTKRFGAGIFSSLILQRSNFTLQTSNFFIAAALFWSIASSLWVYPHSLSYFNKLAGGPIGGPAHLINSNVDWGQDLLYLKRWLAEHGQPQPLCLAYYGSVDPRYVGIDYRLPPFRADATAAAPRLSPGWYAISVNFLRGYPFRSYDGNGGNGGQQWLPAHALSYFQRLRPVGMAGYSIYIYHIAAEQSADPGEPEGRAASGLPSNRR